jgi:hypothetical protein
MNQFDLYLWFYTAWMLLISFAAGAAISNAVSWLLPLVMMVGIGLLILVCLMFYSISKLLGRED